MKPATAFCFFLGFFLSFPLLAQDAPQPWMIGFEKPLENPILGPDSLATFFCPVRQKEVHWQRADVFNPGAIVRKDTVYLFFRAEDNPDARLGERTSRIGLAYSLDGLSFTKFEQPVLFPDEDDFKQWEYPGGVEDPRVVELEDGSYLMLYTSWNNKVARLSSAISRDLFHWEKQGPVFETAHQGKFSNRWSKSGAVVTQLKDGRLVARKIDGKYVMYWGELFVNVAYSMDGKDWTPALNAQGELLEVFRPTRQDFDSHLVEPGPPALWTEAGILLFYNGKNLEGEGSGNQTPDGTYCGGQALFNAQAPEQLLARMPAPFICPSLPHELTGQYKAGTTFIQGLVYFDRQWLLYYGTADSLVGLALKSSME